MKKLNITSLLCLIFLSVNTVTPQEKLILGKKDTLRFSQKEFPPCSLQVNYQLFNYKEKDFIKLIVKNFKPSTEGMTKPDFYLSNQDILYPLYKQYLENKKYQIWFYIVTVLRDCLAGYLAFKHVEKYGFK